ncbi:J domain-containing protein [Xanthobacter sp. TB0139]|uniref:J domain-containing protein n=1 Tax=Xanthobacter sp. TB0139 TaxID=3459178 RepID=UPI00403A753D
MKLDSPLFDRIRVKPEDDRSQRPVENCCQWPGCAAPATHRAPKGRDREGQYWNYCFEHVKQYNQSYNYFAGMSDDAMHAYQKDALTGHRPTWRMGARKGTREEAAAGGAGAQEGFDADMDDPFGFASEMGRTFRQDNSRTDTRRATIRNAERQALEIMGLDISVSSDDIKARYKELVKLHHPDANGGDRSSEDRLRSVIQAYTTLKQAGMV